MYVDVFVSVGGGRGIYHQIGGDVPHTLLRRMMLDSFIPAEILRQTVQCGEL